MLGTLQSTEEQLPSKLRKVLKGDALCFDLCGADLKGLIRGGISSITRDRPARAVRNHIRNACKALARSQQRSLPSIAE